MFMGAIKRPETPLTGCEQNWFVPFLVSYWCVCVSFLLLQDRGKINDHTVDESGGSKRNTTPRVDASLERAIRKQE
eukprot:1781408-Amphidinium_carterae.1